MISNGRTGHGKIEKKYFLIVISICALAAAALFFNRLINPRRLNVLLITVDALRPDHLGCYGYKRNTSPNIDKLTKEGILFTQAISQASWTHPSIYSLITSTYPSTYGIYFWDQDLPDSVPTLTRVLKEEGYGTAFISGHGGISGVGKFAQGFDTFKDIYGAEANRITREALSWIKNYQNRHFFLWIHYMDTHDRSLGLPEKKHHIKNITPEEIKLYTLKYDEAIRYVDTQIASLLLKLKETGSYKDTIIFISSDHGQDMCEHNLCFSHGGFVWDSGIKVPLIIISPKLLPRNKIVTQQVQHIDIAPTICDILEIKKPNIFEGRSLLPLIKGRNINPGFALSEHREFIDGLNIDTALYTKVSIRSPGGWKMINTYSAEDNKYELYNLKIDPNEQNNLAEIEKEELELLKNRLEQWMKRPMPEATPLRKRLGEKEKGRLKALGYLQ